MTTLFVNKLTVIDFSLLHPDLGLLGESWQVDIELDGSLDHQGMVLDFSDVKRQVKAAIDSGYDHRLLVPSRHSGCRVTEQQHRCELLFTLNSGETLRHSAPTEAITLIDSELVDEGAVTEAIISHLSSLLPDNVEDIRLHLHSESVEGAWYRYSHGLKHHAGNCQRIAHGHRSRIEIYRDNQRDQKLEHDWAERWRDIYIGTRSDLLEEFEREGNEYYRFGYTANQGLFELELLKKHCYIVDSDSTVENLAQHIADTLKREHPTSQYKVLAFEGVDKGAIGRA
ncbi:MAG: 6-carboxytetrahydropterin synthase [Candidatus Sedimenticola sp. (ex Thyasira tokunagai)]